MFGFALYFLDLVLPRMENPPEKKLTEACLTKPGQGLFLRYGNDGVFNTGLINKRISFPGDFDQFSALISFGHDPRNKFNIVNYDSIEATRSDVIQILTTSSFENIHERHLIKGMRYVPLPESHHRRSSRRERRLDWTRG